MQKQGICCHARTGTDGEENDSGLDGFQQEEKELSRQLKYEASADIIGAHKTWTNFHHCGFVRCYCSGN
jgi:hypothetical protein